MVNRERPALRRDLITFAEIRDLVGRDDPCILEVGANSGVDSNRFLNTFPGCRLFCFEPDARAVEVWKRTVKDPRANLIASAVGREDGVLPFFASSGRETEQHPGGWNKSGSLRKPKGHLEKYPFVEFKKTVEVPCIRLDTWTSSEGIGEVDFIWADVQGAEEDLIAGGVKTLERTRYFYTEYSNRELYEGQITLDRIEEVLPEFDMLALFSMDVLFKRRA